MTTELGVNVFCKLFGEWVSSTDVALFQGGDLRLIPLERSSAAELRQQLQVRVGAGDARFDVLYASHASNSELVTISSDADSATFFDECVHMQVSGGTTLRVYLVPHMSGNHMASAETFRKSTESDCGSQSASQPRGLGAVEGGGEVRRVQADECRRLDEDLEGGERSFPLHPAALQYQRPGSNASAGKGRQSQRYRSHSAYSARTTPSGVAAAVEVEKSPPWESVAKTFSCLFRDEKLSDTPPGETAQEAAGAGTSASASATRRSSISSSQLRPQDRGALVPPPPTPTVLCTPFKSPYPHTHEVRVRTIERTRSGIDRLNAAQQCLHEIHAVLASTPATSKKLRRNLSTGQVPIRISEDQLRTPGPSVHLEREPTAAARQLNALPPVPSGATVAEATPPSAVVPVTVAARLTAVEPSPQPSRAKSRGEELGLNVDLPLSPLPCDATLKSAVLLRVESMSPSTPAPESPSSSAERAGPYKGTPQVLQLAQLQLIPSSQLQRVRELGRGTYATVYLGSWRGAAVAIKQMHQSVFEGADGKQQLEDFYAEQCTLASLAHPNIVTFYGVVEEKVGGCPGTVQQYMQGGSLRKALSRIKRRCADGKGDPDAPRIKLALDTARGVEYLHWRRVIHFDIKADNIMTDLKDPKRPTGKIGDLGLAKLKSSTYVSCNMRGTLPWMAPELFPQSRHIQQELCGTSSSPQEQADRVTEKIDVYSFGVLMWEIWTWGAQPYDGLQVAEVFHGMMVGNLRPKIPASTPPSPGWKALMQSCWDADPASRPSFEHLVSELGEMLKQHADFANE